MATWCPLTGTPLTRAPYTCPPSSLKSRRYVLSVTWTTFVHICNVCKVPQWWGSETQLKQFSFLISNTKNGEKRFKICTFRQNMKNKHISNRTSAFKLLILLFVVSEPLALPPFLWDKSWTTSLWICQMMTRSWGNSWICTQSLCPPSTMSPS